MYFIIVYHNVCMKDIRIIIVIFSFLICNITSEANITDSLIAIYNNRTISDDDSILFYLCKEISLRSVRPEIKRNYAKYAFEYGIKQKNIKWQAAAKYVESYSYAKEGELDSAISTMLHSQFLYGKVKFNSGVYACKIWLAGIYRRNKEYLLAEKNYLEVIKYYQDENDTLKQIASLINLGELYRIIGKKESSIRQTKRALVLCYGIEGDNTFLAYAKGNIGLVYAAQNKLDSAKIYLNKSIEILEPLGDNYAVSSYLDGLAEVYFKCKQYNRARQTAHKSLLLAQEHGLKEQIRDASLRLSTIYDQSKDFEKAFYHHKQYVAYRDSINNEETIRKIASLHTKYEVAQKQKEVDAEKAYKNRYLIIAISASSVLILLTVLVFIILKISRERRKTNIVLEQQRKDLENANATKNKFFSILSHDLRSPLATFHSYAEVIEICSQHQDLDKLLVLGKELKSSSANMLDLLDNLLQWGVNQMGDHKLTPTTVDLKDVALLEVEHLQHVSNKKNIDVIVSIQPSLTLFVDRVQLSITLRNLLNNAIKFTPAEGTVIIAAEDSKQVTTLKVTDTGVGMTQEQKETLFDFNKINSTYGTQNEKGVGLGMQLVCGFVKENKAKLYVETELGKGTTFAIVFEKR